MYDMGHEERRKMGLVGLEHATENFNLKDFGEKWVNLLTEVYEKEGSWETRKNYTRWSFKEI